MSFQLVHFSSCGSVRATNQDAYCVRISMTSSGFVAMGLVCDGMGGMNCGEIASATVSVAFGDWFDTRVEDCLCSGLTSECIAADWKEIVNKKHRLIADYAEQNGLRIGTTLSVILFTERKYFLMHVGDSRIYLDDGNIIRQLTKDQTLAMRELEAGRITQEQYQSDRRRNVLLQCVGNSSVSPVFMVGETPQAGSVLLCSDGFYHTVCPEELHKVMTVRSGKKEFQCMLLDLASRGRSLGESDNMTCVAVRWNAAPMESAATACMDGSPRQGITDNIAKINFSTVTALS